MLEDTKNQVFGNGKLGRFMKKLMWKKGRFLDSLTARA